MTMADLRATMELHWRQKLHAQITALEARLEELEHPPYAIQWLRRLKLKRKIERLYAELNQPILLDTSGGAARSGRRSGAGEKRRRAG